MSTSTNPLPASDSRLIRLLSKGLAVLTLGVAAVLLVVFAWLGITWFQQPYPGFIVAPDTTVANPYTFIQQPSEAALAGLQVGDRVLSINRVQLEPGDVQALLRDVFAETARGDSVALWFDRSAGLETPAGADCITIDATRQQCVATVALTRYPLVDFVIQFGFAWLVGLVGLLAAAWFLRWRWESERARSVVILTGLLSMLAAGLFDMHTSRVLGPQMYPPVLVTVGGLMLMLAVHFPTRLAIVRRYPVLQLVAPLILLAALLAVVLRPGGLAEQAQALAFAVAFTGGAWLALMAALLWRVRQAVSPGVRDQCAIVIAGMLLALAPLLVWLFSTGVNLNLLGQNLGFHFALVTPFLFMLPLSMAYSMARGVLPHSDRVISQGIVYSIMGLAITLGYGLLVAGVSLFTGAVVQLNNPLVIAVTVFLVALLFVPVRNALERRVNNAYFRSHRLYQNRVEQLAQDLTQVAGLPGVVDAIRAALEETLNPTHAFLFFPDDASQKYVAFGVPSPETDIRFDQEGSLVRYLLRHERALYLGVGDPLPPELAPERSRLAVLGAAVLLPLRGRDRLSGLLAVGPRQSATRYVHEDLAFMQAVADQAALAVERAQVISNLEQRVREMNVLGQVAQAVNYTVEFDDLLELIYAQTNRVVDAPNFYIALRDPNTDELYYGFYSQDDERMPDREGVRWRIGRDLLSEIVRTGQP
ncbi:MAG: GAF domain-containing protein, partial [Anaerolineae bacterium]|nr:GAF domain-containing protein [Anaerolineae bacterium]